MATANHVLPPLPPRRRVAPLISPFAQIKTVAVGRRAAARGDGEPGTSMGNGDGDEETLRGEEQKLQIELQMGRALQLDLFLLVIRPRRLVMKLVLP